MPFKYANRLELYHCTKTDFEFFLQYVIRKTVYIKINQRSVQDYNHTGSLKKWSATMRLRYVKQSSVVVQGISPWSSEYAKFFLPIKSHRYPMLQLESNIWNLVQSEQMNNYWTSMTWDTSKSFTGFVHPKFNFKQAIIEESVSLDDPSLSIVLFPIKFLANLVRRQSFWVYSHAFYKYSSYLTVPSFF